MSTDCVSNLLLVEDNAQDVALLRHCLQRSEVDAHVTQVTGLQDAIAACKHRQFDVVLLDLNLPDSKGEATAAEFCGIFNDLPVVILSGLSEKKMGAGAISQGAQDYLLKDDLTPAQLHRAIRYAVSRHGVRADLMRRNDALFSELNRQIQQSRIRFGFISAATHQLKGPLSLISVCLESLQAANAEPDDQLRRKRLGQMEQAITVVFEFLDAIQVTSVKMEDQASCTPVELSVDEVCTDIIAGLVLAGAASNCVQLRVENLPDRVQLDPILLRYVLSNVLSNAAKYSAEGETVDLTVSQDGTWIKFLVCDRGIGIPPEEQVKILTPFYRAANARVAHSGSGLGLAIVQTCIELHRGRFEIDSSLGEGTRVSVYFPLNLDDTDQERDTKADEVAFDKILQYANPGVSQLK